MTEQVELEKKPLVIALGRGYNGFFCTTTRLHLIGVVRPQAVYPFDVLSEEVKQGLRGGTLVDVNGVLTIEDIAPSKQATYGTPGDLKKVIAEQVEDKLKEQAASDEEPKETAPTMLSEEDINTATIKVLTTFVESLEGVTLESLGLSSKPKVDELRTALKIHLGYIEAPKEEKE